MAPNRKATSPGRNSDDKLIGLFLDMLAAEQGSGANTIAAYRRDLDDLSSFIAGRKRQLRDATTDDLRGYLSDLDARGFKPSSAARRLSVMRHLFRFLLGEGLRKDDPAAILSGPKRTRPLPKVLSIADVDRLLTQTKAEIARCADKPLEKLRATRLACLLEVLYATGLRVSELVALPLSAARRDARMIVVRGKGNKERLVPLNDAARQAMAAHLQAMAAARTRGGDAQTKWL